MIRRVTQLNARQRKALAETCFQAFSSSALFDGSHGQCKPHVAQAWWTAHAERMDRGGVLLASDDDMSAVLWLIPAPNNPLSRTCVDVKAEIKREFRVRAGTEAVTQAEEWAAWRDRELDTLAGRRGLNLDDVDEISDLAVHPERQNRQLGSQLLQYVLQNRTRPVMLWCEDHVVGFYASHGMEIVRTATYKTHEIYFMLAPVDECEVAAPSPPYYPPEALLARAEELLGSTDYELARKFVERVLERRPSDSKALELLATIELEFDESDAAKGHLLQAVRILSDTGAEPSSSAHLYLAQLADSPPEALENFEAALKVLRRRIQGFGTMLGRANGKGPAWSEAEAQARRSASRALVGMTELYLTDLCMEDEAEQRCEEYISEAHQLDPTNSEALQTMASVRISQQRDADARDCLSQAFALWRDLDPFDPDDQPSIPPFDTRLSLATLMVETRQLSDAIDVLNGLEAVDDSDLQVFYLRGLAWCLLLESKQGGEGIAPVFGGEADEVSVMDCGIEGRGALERAKMLLSKETKPDDEDRAMMAHIDELLDKLIAAGIPAPDPDAAADDEDEWEDEEGSENDTMQQ